MTDRSTNQPVDSGRGRGSGRQGGGGGGGGRGRGGRSYYHPPYPSDDQLDREPDRGPKKKFHGNRSYDATEENEGPGSGGGRGRGGRGGHHHHPKPKFSDRKHDPHLIADPINAPSIFADVTDNALPIPSIVGRGSSGAKHVTTPPPPPTPTVNTSTSTVTPVVPELVQQPKSSAAPSSNKEKDKEVVPNKKMHKLIFRKLPATQTYTAERFHDHLTALLRRLNLPESVFRVDHFSPGKLSRKRGPIFSTAYVTVLEEEHHDSFVTRVPSQVSFIEDDGNSNVGQPEIGVAPYNKSFRFKEKTDKYVNTYEEDPIFQAFKQRIENPESAHSARPDGTPGNVTLAPPPAQPAQSLEDKLKTNSLLNFLREKAAKKLSLKKAKKEKKLGKEKDKLGGTSIITKRDKEEKERERKERRKKKRKAKKAKELGLAGVMGESEGVGGTLSGGGASVTNASKKKRSRKKKEKVKEGAVGDEDRLVEGEIGGGGDAPKKITILKKEKVVLAGGGGGGGGDGGSVATASTSLTGTSTVSDAFPLSAGAAPSTAKLSRREKSRLKREQLANVTANTSSDYVAEGSGGIDYQDQRNDVIPSDPYYSHTGSGGGRGGGGGYQGRGGGGGRWKRNYHY